MKSISDTTLQFLRFLYEGHVASFLEDPDEMCVPGGTSEDDPAFDRAVIDEIASHYLQLVTVGEDLGTPFWEVARRVGMSHQLDRLTKYLWAADVVVEG